MMAAAEAVNKEEETTVEQHQQASGSADRPRTKKARGTCRASSSRQPGMQGLREALKPKATLRCQEGASSSPPLPLMILQVQAATSLVRVQPDCRDVK